MENMKLRMCPAALIYCRYLHSHIPEYTEMRDGSTRHLRRNLSKPSLNGERNGSEREFESLVGFRILIVA